MRWRRVSTRRFTGLILLALVSASSARALDCNRNGREDLDDIAAGASVDCNADGVPDECERAPLEIALGTDSIALAESPRDIVAADFDGDGLDDFATVERAGRIAVFFSAGQAFEPGTIVAVPGSPRAAVAVDLDGDGDVDLATAVSDRLQISYNEGGRRFSRPVEVVVPNGTRFVAAADVSGDGRVDLLATSTSSDAVLVAEQTEAGEFGAPLSWSAGDSPQAVAAGDFDRDGDLDLATANRRSGDVSIFENAGPESAGAARLVARDSLAVETTNPFAIELVDVSGDGAADVVLGSADAIVVWLSAGDGSFREPDVYPCRPESLAVFDIDEDGALDIVYGDFEANDVVVLGNLGAGVFAPRDPLVSGFRRSVLAPGDFDGDGDVDLAAIALGLEHAEILWNAEPSLSRVAFRTRSLFVDDRPHGIGAGDLTGDGLPEVITANGHFDSFTVFRNLGGGEFADRDEHNQANVGHFNDVEAPDLDGDRDLDLIVLDQDGGRLFAYENDGSGQLTLSRPYALGVRPWTMTIGDLDGDSDIDVAATLRGGGGVALLLNDGSGILDTRRLVPLGGEPVTIDAGDFDGDGDLDLAVANLALAVVNLLENDGSAEFPQVRTHTLPGPVLGVGFGDFDGDGRLDLATANDRRVTVSLNAGGGRFSAPEVIDVEFSTYTIEIGDFNLDGRVDFLSDNRESSSVGTFIGNGDGTFSPPHEHFVGQQPLGAEVVDLDADGDVDVATADRSSLTVTYLLNQSVSRAFPATHLERICTGRDFARLSAVSRAGEIERVLKFVVPATEDPDLLPPVFQNSVRFPLHQQFLAAVFPDRFPGLTALEYSRLALERGTRAYFAGSISRLRVPTGDGGTEVGYGFSLAGSEPANAIEAEWVYSLLLERFGLGPLGYLPLTAAEDAAARSWNDPPFPIFASQSADGADYEAYTLAVGYGRVRILDAEAFATANDRGIISFQNLIVLDHAPQDIEGVVGGVITGEPQGQLSHVAVRTARRGTPNAFVAEAHEAFEAFSGELVRLEVHGDGYEVRLATVEEAEEFWRETRPEVPDFAAPDETTSSLATLDEIAALDAAGEVSPESRYGGKASNLARLRSALAGGPHADLAPRGFAVPVREYSEFMRTNEIPSALDAERIVSYAEYLSELMALDSFATDPSERFDRLAYFRDYARERGVVSSGLVTRIALKVADEFGSTRLGVRCRSSSNVEDLLEFSGAGLYESTGACAADDLDPDEDGPSACDAAERDERNIADALKIVWTSLWTFRAYEEREFFGIDQAKAAMGVLVSIAFDGERANGVAFTGNTANPRDRRYVVTVQVGEESVVSPRPGIVAERDLLEMRDGTVARIVRPARGSSLVPAGTWVLSDDELRDLGALMAHVDAAFPVELGAHPRERVLLDFEFKIVADGTIALKQVRPFLHVLPAPPAPTFALEIPRETVVCGAFRLASDVRGPREEYERKGQIRLAAGTFDLPTSADTFDARLIEEVRFGPERALAASLGPGRIRVTRIPGDGSDASFVFGYEEEFETASGDILRVELRLPRELRGRGAEPIDPTVILDGPTLLPPAGEELVVGWIDDIAVASFAACDVSSLPRWTVSALLEGGARLALEERFLPPENTAKTGPASVEWGEFSVAGQRRFVTDYWRLVYSAFRHNTSIRYWVVFASPLDLPGVPAPVHAVELSAPDELAGTAAAFAYLGEDFEPVATGGVAEFGRAEALEPPLERFRRGDVDASGTANLADAVAILEHLFTGGVDPACAKAADADDDGGIRVNDAIWILNFLFAGGLRPAEPVLRCGLDPTNDSLECQFGGCS